MILTELTGEWLKLNFPIPTRPVVDRLTWGDGHLKHDKGSLFVPEEGGNFQPR
jgi:hypothetical protein